MAIEMKKKDNRTLEEVMDNCDKILSQCSDEWLSIGKLLSQITITAPQGERAPIETTKPK